MSSVLADLGIFDNNLNTNIPFLLLGLGIDDAFVLTSEFNRATVLLGRRCVQISRRFYIHPQLD